MQPYKRSARVSDLVRQEVADIIMNKIKHKTFGFVTVTGAKVTDDLRNATIYISVLDDAEKERTIRKLNSMISFFKGELGKRLRMKFIPIPIFKIDESIEYGRKIDGIFADINSDRGPVDDDEDLF